MLSSTVPTVVPATPADRESAPASMATHPTGFEASASTPTANARTPTTVVSHPRLRNPCSDPDPDPDPDPDVDPDVDPGGDPDGGLSDASGSSSVKSSMPWYLAKIISFADRGFNGASGAELVPSPPTRPVVDQALAEFPSRFGPMVAASASGE